VRRTESWCEQAFCPRARVFGNLTRAMNEQDYIALAELIVSTGVVESPICLARQVRHGTRVSRAEARREISAFAMEMSKFNAEHSDRLARVHGPDALSPGDDLFRWWNPMMMFLHAETC